MRNADFDAIKHTASNGKEYWLARELQPLLGYSRWENFVITIERAITACNNSGIAVYDHFRETTKMIDLGKGGKRPIPDIAMTRYACYLVVQNGDPRKEVIARREADLRHQTTL